MPEELASDAPGPSTAESVLGYLLVAYVCVVVSAVVFVKRRALPDYDVVGEQAYDAAFETWSTALLFTTVGQTVLTLVALVGLALAQRRARLRATSRRWMVVLALVCVGSCGATADDVMWVIKD